MTTRVLHVFATFDAGGPQVRAAQLLARWPDAAHAIVAVDGRTGCAPLLPAGVPCELLAAPPRGGLRTLRALRALLRARRPDLLLTYNWGAIEALPAARLAGVRNVVHHEDGFGPEEADRQLRRRVLARRAVLRCARALIVPSSVLERLALQAWRQPRHRVHLLPNGVDLQRFRPSAPAAREVPVLGTVGGLRPVKNQQLLLRAFARMRHPARLELVGDGTERGALEALARELGIGDRVRFAGAVADTSAVYGRFDAFALPSQSEQMPLVVLEAMACGLPLAATDVGDVASMVAEANRPYVVPRGDAAALAAALDALVGDAELRRRLGDANRARCEREYEAGTCYQRFLDVYRAAAAPA
jgi:glycosyltransferase involved in cell wall biosynthesis